jgi:hypothetical protein
VDERFRQWVKSGHDLRNLRQDLITKREYKTMNNEKIKGDSLTGKKKKKFDWGWAACRSIFGIAIGVTSTNPIVIIVAAIVGGVIFGALPS